MTGLTVWWGVMAGCVPVCAVCLLMYDMSVFMLVCGVCMPSSIVCGNNGPDWYHVMMRSTITIGHPRDMCGLL